MSEKQQRNRKTAGRVLIAAGCFIIVFVIAINAFDLAKSEIAINEFKEQRASADVGDSDNEANEILQDENATLCLLKISKINLEEAVKEGSTRGVLSSTLGHVENTALPGENGNCCIAGHRNYVFGKFFNRLEEIELGDVIEIETRDSVYTYEVDSINVVAPEAVSVLDDEEGQNLTLITCTPFMVGTHRLIVHATIK